MTGGRGPLGLLTTPRDPGYSRPTCTTCGRLRGPGMTCPPCQQRNPSRANSCLAWGVPLKEPDETRPPTYADLQRSLSEVLEREAGAVRRETEALDRETATSEILKVIAASPAD